MQFEIFCGSAAITSSLNSQMNDAELTSIAAEVGALLTNFKWRSGLTGGLLLRRVLCPGKVERQGTGSRLNLGEGKSSPRPQIGIVPLTLP